MDQFVKFWQNLWQQIVDFFTSGDATQGELSLLNRVIIAAIILIVGLLLVKIIFWGLRRALGVSKNGKNQKRTATRFILNCTKTLVIFFIILFALSTLGFELSGLSTVISSGILAIGVSLQDIISNFASGIIILSTKLFAEGDYIEVNDSIAGSVKEIKMMTTVLLTPNNILITVPNNTITKGKVSNFDGQETRRIDITASVAYGTDLEKAKKVLMNILVNEPRVLKDENISVGVKNLGASSIDFAVRCYVPTSLYWAVTFDLNEKIATELASRNINIPFNQLDVNLYKQEANKTPINMRGIPADVLDYKPLPHKEKEVYEDDIDKALAKAKKFVTTKKKQSASKKETGKEKKEVKNTSKKENK